jgi:hypothetical protein
MLPTPDASVFNDGQTVEAWQERKARELAKGYNGNGGGTPLAMAVRLLPTPEAKLEHSGPDYARMGREDSGGDDLTTALWRLLPTPQSADAARGVEDPNRQDRADRQGRAKPTGANLGPALLPLIPTPTARDWKAGSGVPERDRPVGDDDLTTRLMRLDLLPTPQTRDGDPRHLMSSAPVAAKRFEEGRRNLDDAISLLPTPTADDAKATRNRTAGRSNPSSRHHDGQTLLDVFWTPAEDMPLLPTPRASDGEKGGPNQRGSSGDLMLPSAVMDVGWTGESTSPPSDGGNASSGE